MDIKKIGKADKKRKNGRSKKVITSDEEVNGQGRKKGRKGGVPRAHVVSLTGYIPKWYACPKLDTHPVIN